MSGPSWYDVLGVARDASTAEIEAAWQAETAGRTPADRRFKLATQAAEVLLDPRARADYDATLAPADDGTPEPVAPGVTEQGGEPVRHGKAGSAGPGEDGPAAPDDDAPASSGSPVATGGLVGALGRAARPLAVLAALLVVLSVVALVLNPEPAGTSDLPNAREVAAARAAAEAAVVPVLSYDYRDLEASRAAAVSYLTPAYAEEYNRNFDAYITELAPQSKTIVTTRLVTLGGSAQGQVASSVVRTGPDRVDVLVFVNRPTQNATRTVEYKDFVTLQMVRTGDRWLVGCLVTQDGGACTD